MVSYYVHVHVYACVLRMYMRMHLYWHLSLNMSPYICICKAYAYAFAYVHICVSCIHAKVFATLVTLLFQVENLSWDRPFDHFECFAGDMSVTQAEWADTCFAN